MILLLCPAEPRLHAQQLAEQIYYRGHSLSETQMDVAASFSSMKCGWPAVALYEPVCRIYSYSDALEVLQRYRIGGRSLLDIDYVTNAGFYRSEMEH